MTSAPFNYKWTRSFLFDREAAWELLANTDHMNRVIGIPSVTYSDAEETADGIVRMAEAKVLGQSLAWQEFPFEWERLYYYRVHRVYLSGPFHHLNVSARFEDGPAPSTTKITMEFNGTARSPWIRGLARLVARKTSRDSLKYCLQFERLRQANAGYAELPAIISNEANLDELEKFRRLILPTLRPDPELQTAAFDRLCDRIRTGSDEQLLKMQPLRLSHEWGMAANAVLRMCLNATVGGLLRMDWVLMCPTCRVSKQGFASLADINPNFRCEFCNTDHVADLDTLTELRFSVSESVREVSDQTFCLGSPANAPHILVQQNLSPSEDRLIAMASVAGRGSLRLRTLRSNLELTLSGELAGQVFSFDGKSFHHTTEKVDGDHFEVKNLSKRPLSFVVETTKWDPFATIAAEVALMPDFRRLLSHEVIQPGRDVGIRNICILFTDIRGSTSLYEKIGDASAFGRVSKHFDFLTEIVEKNGGSVIKTIGDAVMAAFHRAQFGLDAALEMQTRIAEFNKAHGYEPPLSLKIGIHAGSAIAVNANNKLDYFGRTINIAARVQQQSQGGDIILTEELLHEQGTQDKIRSLKCSHYETELRGIPGLWKLTRVEYR